LFPLTKDIWFAGEAHAEKYNSGNKIANGLVRRFLLEIFQMAQSARPQSVHEVGCGEGHVLAALSELNKPLRGSDVSESSLAIAKREIEKYGLDVPLHIRSVYELQADDSADLIVCCEVLEHLVDPAQALASLLSVTKGELILSVPREPIWHILNMSRGKYWNALGNTPGHYNHWTKKQFVDFVSEQADILEVRSPLPWTLIRCRPKKDTQQGQIL
jgi:2-polyprenyl-3-methyl-5-hydroxy-6-metoxy-1,4-benzoquinol methylase